MSSYGPEEIGQSAPSQIDAAMLVMKENLPDVSPTTLVVEILERKGFESVKDKKTLRRCY